MNRFRPTMEITSMDSEITVQMRAIDNASSEATGVVSIPITVTGGKAYPLDELLKQLVDHFTGLFS